MISSMIIGYICCFTLVVGMMRKSIPVTLVSSIIFINLRQFILAGTNTTQDSLISVFIIVEITVIDV
ncbi:hypothetical protein ACWYRQ_01370 [Clostridioides difficile]